MTTDYRDPVVTPGGETVLHGTGAHAGAGGAVRRVSWGAIFAGTAIAMAAMVFFTTLGIGIGAASVDPLYDQNPLSGITTGTAIYIVVTQMISLAIGGYVAARLAGIPRTPSALIHGAAVWAVSTLALAYLASVGAGAAFGAATTVVQNTAQAAVSAGRAVLPDDVDLPSPADLAAGVSIEDLPPEVQRALQRQGITAENIRSEAREALRDVVSREEQQNAVQAAQNAAVDAIRTPGDIPSDVNQLIDRLFGGPNAVLSEEDRAEALTVIEERFGITPEEAEQFLASAEQQAQEAAAQVEQSVEAARQQATEAAQQATSTLSTAAFLLALASILGLAAAVGGGIAGKPDDMVGDRLGDHA